MIKAILNTASPFTRARSSRFVADGAQPSGTGLPGPLPLHYKPAYIEAPLLLIASEQGLTPLLPLLGEALSQEHRGGIWVYHSAARIDQLIHEHELRQMARLHPQLHYRPCLSGSQKAEGYLPGRAEQMALLRHPDLRGWVVCASSHAYVIEKLQLRTLVCARAFHAQVQPRGRACCRQPALPVPV